MEKSVIILKALKMGFEIEKCNEVYKSECNQLYIKRQQDTVVDGKVIKSEEVWLNCEPSFSWFLNFCDEFTEDQIAILCANMALTNFKREKT